MVTRWLTRAATAKSGSCLRQAPPPVEWLVSDRPVAYDSALAAMTSRAAAIARGEAGELVWLLEHPPLYTAGTQRRRQRTDRGALSGVQSGRGGQMTYHGPGQRVGYVMLDLQRRGPDVRRFVATLEEWIIRTLAAFNVRGERREDRIGVWVRRPGQGRRLRGQDRRHRHPRDAMGDAARHGAECRAGPVAFFRHRAVRGERAALRRHLPRRSRASRCRCPKSTWCCARSSSRCSARRSMLRRCQHRK